MKLFKPKAPDSAYLISGGFFPEGGARINSAEPFYARQIADGDLIAADASTHSNANDGEHKTAVRGKSKTKRKG